LIFLGTDLGIGIAQVFTRLTRTTSFWEGEVMSRRIRSLSLALAFVSGLILASNANALPVNVTYDIAITTGVPSYGIPQTSTGTGSLTVQFANGTPGSHASPGALHVVGGTIMATAAYTYMGDAITGNRTIQLFSSGAGSVTAGGAFNLSVQGVVTAGQIHCFGATCAYFGAVPSVVSGTTGAPILGFLSGVIGGFPSLGPQTIAGSGAGLSGPTPGYPYLPYGTWMLTGVEVGREHVPEPTTGALVGLGLAAFGSVGVAARRRRARA
jgi:hypothetical protein